MTYRPNGGRQAGPDSREGRKGLMRRRELIDAARSLYEEKGLSRTSVLDIAQRVGVTRSLFYHYFPNKDQITVAVLDTYVSDFVEALHYWNEQRVPGETGQSLRSLLKIFRSAIFENNSFRLDLVNKENAGLYMQFTASVADQIARFIIDAVAEDYAKRYPVKIGNIYESVYVLIVGLIALIRANPTISQEVVFDLAVQALRLEEGVRGAGARKSL